MNKTELKNSLQTTLKQFLTNESLINSELALFDSAVQNLSPETHPEDWKQLEHNIETGKLPSRWTKKGLLQATSAAGVEVSPFLSAQEDEVAHIHASCDLFKDTFYYRETTPADPDDLEAVMESFNPRKMVNPMPFMDAEEVKRQTGLNPVDKNFGVPELVILKNATKRIIVFEEEDGGNNHGRTERTLDYGANVTNFNKVVACNSYLHNRADKTGTIINNKLIFAGECKYLAYSHGKEVSNHLHRKYAEDWNNHHQDRQDKKTSVVYYKTNNNDWIDYDFDDAVQTFLRSFCGKKELKVGECEVYIPHTGIKDKIVAPKISLKDGEQANYVIEDVNRYSDSSGLQFIYGTLRVYGYFKMGFELSIGNPSAEHKSIHPVVNFYPMDFNIGDLNTADADGCASYFDFNYPRLLENTSFIPVMVENTKDNSFKSKFLLFSEVEITYPVLSGRERFTVSLPFLAEMDSVKPYHAKDFTIWRKNLHDRFRYNLTVSFKKEELVELAEALKHFTEGLLHFSVSEEIEKAVKDNEMLPEALIELGEFMQAIYKDPLSLLNWTKRKEAGELLARRSAEMSKYLQKAFKGVSLSKSLIISDGHQFQQLVNRMDVSSFEKSKDTGATIFLKTNIDINACTLRIDKLLHEESYKVYKSENDVRKVPQNAIKNHQVTLNHQNLVRILCHYVHQDKDQDINHVSIFRQKSSKEFDHRYLEPNSRDDTLETGVAIGTGIDHFLPWQFYFNEAEYLVRFSDRNQDSDVAIVRQANRTAAVQPGGYYSHVIQSPITHDWSNTKLLTSPGDDAKILADYAISNVPLHNISLSLQNLYGMSVSSDEHWVSFTPEISCTVTVISDFEKRETYHCDRSKSLLLEPNEDGKVILQLRLPESEIVSGVPFSYQLVRKNALKSKQNGLKLLYNDNADVYAPHSTSTAGLVTQRFGNYGYDGSRKTPRHAIDQYLAKSSDYEKKETRDVVHNNLRLHADKAAHKYKQAQQKNKRVLKVYKKPALLQSGTSPTLINPLIHTFGAQNEPVLYQTKGSLQSIHPGMLGGPFDWVKSAWKKACDLVKAVISKVKEAVEILRKALISVLDWVDDNLGGSFVTSFLKNVINTVAGLVDQGLTLAELLVDVLSHLFDFDEIWENVKALDGFINYQFEVQPRVLKYILNDVGEEVDTLINDGKKALQNDLSFSKIAIDTKSAEKKIATESESDSSIHSDYTEMKVRQTTSEVSKNLDITAGGDLEKELLEGLQNLMGIMNIGMDVAYKLLENPRDAEVHLKKMLSEILDTNGNILKIIIKGAEKSVEELYATIKKAWNYEIPGASDLVKFFGGKENKITVGRIALFIPAGQLTMLIEATGISQKRFRNDFLPLLMFQKKPKNLLQAPVNVDFSFVDQQRLKFALKAVGGGLTAQGKAMERVAFETKSKLDKAGSVLKYSGYALSYGFDLLSIAMEYGGEAVKKMAEGASASSHGKPVSEHQIEQTWSAAFQKKTYNKEYTPAYVISKLYPLIGSIAGYVFGKSDSHETRALGHIVKCMGYGGGIIIAAGMASHSDNEYFENDFMYAQTFTPPSLKLVINAALAAQYRNVPVYEKIIVGGSVLQLIMYVGLVAGANDEQLTLIPSS